METTQTFPSGQLAKQCGAPVGGGGCYSAAGRNAALTGGAMRRSLENLTQSERSRPRKAMFRRVPSAGNVQNGQVYRDRKHRAGRRGKGEWELTGMGLVWGRYKRSKTNCGDGCTALNILQTAESYALPVDCTACESHLSETVTDFKTEWWWVVGD